MTNSYQNLGDLEKLGEGHIGPKSFNLPYLNMMNVSDDESYDNPMYVRA